MDWLSPFSRLIYLSFEVAMVFWHQKRTMLSDLAEALIKLLNVNLT